MNSPSTHSQHWRDFCVSAPAMAQALRMLTFHSHITTTISSSNPAQLTSFTSLQFPSRKSCITCNYWNLHFIYKVPARRASTNSYQGNGYGDSTPQQLLSSNGINQIAEFSAENFLPIALFSGVVLGLAYPALGCLSDAYRLSKFSTFGVFLISGLTLRSDEIGSAAQAWPVGLFGLASILLISPLLSKIILPLRFQPQEFVTGLAIFCCMPTTLSSGIALTRIAGGNSALALAMTVISNLLSILIVPFSISKLIACGVGVSFPTEPLLRSLISTLLVPLVLGKVFREISPALARTVDANRKPLAVISAILLSFVPWIQISRSRSVLLMVKPATFIVAVIMGGFLHVLLLCFNSSVIPALRLISGGSKSPFGKEENISALVLVASQKTLPVMVAVVEQLGGALGESGLLILPCVAAHLNQIIIDSLLVGRFFGRGRLKIR